MFSLLSELFKQLIQLATYRSARKREIFDKLIEPNYRKAESVTNDLFTFYRELSASAQAIIGWSACDEGFVQAVRDKRAELEASRRRLLSVRMEVIIASKQLSAKKLFGDKVLDDYAKQMFSNILYILQDPEENSSSRPQNMLDALDVCLEPTTPGSSWRNDAWFVSTCAGGFKSLMQSTEFSWGQVAECYTQLRARVYSS